MKEEFHIYTLQNGIRCIHRHTQSGVARCAVIINAGSRDENDNEWGIAHFTEHGFFKGTEHRKAFQVNCRLENLGGELNAYTTKEDTTLHATVMRSDFDKAAELLSDIVFCSTFPDKEITKEREVILDEINTYRDSPADLIYDSFEDMLFEGSQLGHNILGTKKSLNHIDSTAIHNFRHRTHTTDEMVFVSTGNISYSRIEAIARKYFEKWSATTRNIVRSAPQVIAPFEKSIDKHTHQTHCIIGNRAYSINDERRLPLSLLVNILGGPCANSRLNVMVREKHGLTYNIEASYSPYCDTGISVIYFSSDHSNSDKCLELINKELNRVRTESLSTRSLHMAKKQFASQLTISMEAGEGYMMGLGKSLLVNDVIDTMDEVYRKIDAITASQILEVANQVWTSPSTLLYK